MTGLPLNSIATRLSGFGLIWWVLSGGRADGLWLGLLAISAATWASLRLAPPEARAFRLAAVPAFAGYFVWHSVRGGWQVARLAWLGRKSLQPALVELPLALPPGAAQHLMTAALGLMPGSVAVDLVNGRLRMHVLDARQPVVDDVRQLERRVAALFGADHERA
jgi:multicomponent Na+:H+ antiporter subunit E